MDGIPISLMEAMAAGKPVVGSAISGIPELVQHETNGVLVDAARASSSAGAVFLLNRTSQANAKIVGSTSRSAIA